MCDGEESAPQGAGGTRRRSTCRRPAAVEWRLTCLRRRRPKHSSSTSSSVGCATGHGTCSSCLALAAENGVEEGDAFEGCDLDGPLWWAGAVEVDDAERMEDERVHLARCSEAAGRPLVPGPDENCWSWLSTRDERGRLRRLLVADPFPVVADMGQLLTRAGRSEDHLRWRGRFEKVSYRIINLFVDENLDEWRTTLGDAAHRIGAEMSGGYAREALAVLQDDGDFTVVPDPRLSAPDPELGIRIDWKTFDRDRMSHGEFA
jgi:hypothetical protein